MNQSCAVSWGSYELSFPPLSFSIWDEGDLALLAANSSSLATPNSEGIHLPKLLQEVSISNTKFLFVYTTSNSAIAYVDSFFSR